MGKLFALNKILAVFALSLVGSAQAQERMTVGFAAANLEADFFNQVRQAAETAAKAMQVDLLVADAHGDAVTQVSQVQDMLKQGVKALIYIPAGQTAAAVPVRLARTAKVPVVAVDRNPPDAAADTFISTNSVEAARVLGLHACKITGGVGLVAVIQGQLGTTPELDRDKGFTEALTSCPGLKVVEKQPTKAWSRKEGAAVAAEMLKRQPEISLIFGRADALALGAADFLKSANLAAKVKVIGFDGDIAGLEAVKAGVLAATMTQRTRFMGKLAVESAVDLINGKSRPPLQLTDAALTTAENADAMLKDHP